MMLSLPGMRRFLVAGGLAFAPLSPAVAQQAPAIVHNDYGDPSTWICRPGRTDPCAAAVSSTVIRADGTRSRETFAPDPAAPIDCFYVYPTVSQEQAPNSDMTQTAAELGAAGAQFAPFAAVCRTFAPMYRQTTLAELMRRQAAGQRFGVSDLAYNDVRDAWRYYLTHDNNGRGVVLIGHSQGAATLIALIRREIDGTPVQQRIVSAILAGGGVEVPSGRDVGGTFRSMPLCHSSTQTGCVLAWSSFRAEAPPPPGSRFGRARTPGLVPACSNPASLGGGEGQLHSLLIAAALELVDHQLGTSQPFSWVSTGGKITTRYVSLPGLLSAKCISDGSATGYLAVTRHPTPGSARTSDIPGDVIAGGKVQADWGLHVIDINLVLGNLIEIVREQARAYIVTR